MGGEVQVHSCDELDQREWIAARRGGIGEFVGCVDAMLPSMGLFWATSASGERRIIEFDQYRVTRASAANGADALAQAEGGTE